MYKLFPEPESEPWSSEALSVARDVESTLRDLFARHDDVCRRDLTYLVRTVVGTVEAELLIRERLGIDGTPDDDLPPDL